MIISKTILYSFLKIQNGCFTFQQAFKYLLSTQHSIRFILWWPANLEFEITELDETAIKTEKNWEKIDLISGALCTIAWKKRNSTSENCFLSFFLFSQRKTKFQGRNNLILLLWHCSNWVAENIIPRNIQFSNFFRTFLLKSISTRIKLQFFLWLASLPFFTFTIIF